MATYLHSMLSSPDHRHAAMSEIVSAIWTERGNATHTAARLGIHHRTLRKWCAEYPEIQAQLERARAARKAG